jgi:hypothetical protein
MIIPIIVLLLTGVPIMMLQQLHPARGHHCVRALLRQARSLVNGPTVPAGAAALPILPEQPIRPLVITGSEWVQQ